MKIKTAKISPGSLLKLKKIFAGCAEVIAAVLFGSQARGHVTPLSDVDIALFVDEKKVKKIESSYGYQVDMLSKIVPVLHRDDINLVIMNNAPILLRHRIVTQGKIIFCRDKLAYQRFQVKTFHLYVDTEPLRQLMSKQFFRRFK